MKIFGAIFLILAFAVGIGTGELLAGTRSDYPMEDTVWDKVGDWFATVGKSADERDEILLERRTARQAARFQRAIRMESKKAEKKVEKFTKEMEKLFES